MSNMGKPSPGAGNVEIHSTPTHTVLRVAGRDNAGPIAIEVDLTWERAVEHAATVMFCAIRHAPDPDTAMELFCKKLDAAGRSMTMQVIGATAQKGGRA